ncbi:MAG TPA: hypothetical protein VGH89_29515 [Pseudonocardia sp.]
MATHTFLAATVRTATAALVSGVALLAVVGSASAANGVAAPSAPNVQLASFVTAGVAPGCKPGYVWRDARDGDGVCVTPAERTRVHTQNAYAKGKVVPGTVNSCISGYVWRDAWDGDGVCVTPTERDDAHRQNAEAPSHSLS